ncbi:hypothetical protein Mapa_000868 [Marchantia paleacea]|nr:hypothetical protein Mapa_000868 [Marchantia paleacea]
MVKFEKDVEIHHVNKYLDLMKSRIICTLDLTKSNLSAPVMYWNGFHPNSFSTHSMPDSKPL